LFGVHRTLPPSISPQEIYAREGIVCPVIEWEDNSECLAMIAGKAPTSIFNTLAEHSRLPKVRLVCAW
jgi:myosin heavy subunit